MDRNTYNNRDYDRLSIHSEPGLRVFQTTYEPKHIYETNNFNGRSMQTDLHNITSPDALIKLKQIQVGLSNETPATTLLPISYTQPHRKNQGRKNRITELNMHKTRSFNIIAWFVCLFCCFPFGIVAVVKSFQVQQSIRQGRYEEAENASAVTKFFIALAVLSGIIITTVVVTIHLKAVYLNKSLFG